MKYDNTMGSAGKMAFTTALIINMLWNRGTRAIIVKSALTTVWEVLILDVSRWQGIINFLTMASTNMVHGLIPKASQGTVKDPQYNNNAKGATEVGIPIGSYHFYDSRVHPKLQAATWWETIKGSRGELPHAADLEDNYNGPYKGWKNWKIFIEEFLRLSGFRDDRLVIYTAYYYWLSYGPTSNADREFFKRFKLWLAWYTTNPANVKIPPPWTQDDIWAWQYGTMGKDGKTPQGRLFGADSEEIDGNTSPLSLVNFKKAHNIEVPDNGEPVEGEIMWYDAVGAITMRTGPATGYGQAMIDGVAQYVYNEDIVEITLEVNGFGKISRLLREGRLVDLPLGELWCGMKYLQRADEEPEIPTDPDPEEPYVEIYVGSVLEYRDPDGNVIATYKSTMTKAVKQ